MKTASNRKMRLNAIMIGRCQGDDTFVAFQPKGYFPFLKREIPFSFKNVTGKSLFSRDVYIPSIFLGPHFYFVKSPIIRWVPVLLQFYPHVKWSNENTKK